MNERTKATLTYPGFSTAEFENGKTKSGLPHRITSTFYETIYPGFPSMVLGCIDLPDGKYIVATWDRLGLCTSKGKREKSFDLLKPSQIRAKKAKRTLWALVSILILIISSYLWN